MNQEIWVIEKRPNSGSCTPQYLSVFGTSPDAALFWAGNKFRWYGLFESECVLKFYDKKSAIMCLSAIMTLFDENYSYSDRPDGLRYGDTLPEICSHGYIKTNENI